MDGKGGKDSLELIFDGSSISATTKRKSRTIRVNGYSVSASDVQRVLVIMAGTNFIAGVYLIESVDTHSNSWTLDRPCTNGPGFGMTGELVWQEGRWHLQVPEFYDSSLPNNPSQGEARSQVLAALLVIEPDILKSLARRCFKRRLLDLEVPADHGWCGPLDDLMWGHLRDAGRIEPSAGWVILGNLKPLRDALVRWAMDERRKRWNLCDNESEPLDWIADAAVQTVVYWHRKGKLPKNLRWANLDYYCYRSLENENDYRMFDLERQFVAGSGFIPRPREHESPGMVPEMMRFARIIRLPREPGAEPVRLSDRAQRKAKKEYKALGTKRGLARMERVSPRYFEWYVLQTFLGFKLGEIRNREFGMKREEGIGVGVGDPNDPNDVSSIAHGIKRVADLVGFHR